MNEWQALCIAVFLMLINWSIKDVATAINGLKESPGEQGKS